MNEKLKREDIYLLRKHSKNWSENGIANVLQTDVYNDAGAWKTFLRSFFAAVGIALSILGIIFFFAYNWSDLHKFAKIGMVEVGICAMVVLALLPKMSEMLKNLILTGASVLVGVLFAVFGQVYQTGANAYDLFWAWAACITLWVLVANFPPLWLVYIVLLNTTFTLYTEQIATNMGENIVCILLICLNLPFLLLSLVAKTWFKDRINAPDWFSNSLALIITGIATMGWAGNIISNTHPDFGIFSVLVSVLFAAGIVYGFQAKRSFYFAIIPLSIIILGCCYLVKSSDGAAMLLFLTVFTVVTVTLVIKNILYLQNKWKNENTN
jgi:uncharacterized membrane protein